MTHTPMFSTARTSVRAVLAASLAGFILAACSTDVENPNNVTEEALANPTAAGSIIAGAENSTTRAMNSIWTPYAAITDETVFKGSRDDYQQLDQGQAGNPANEYTNASSFNVNQARWLADNAVKLLEAFDASGALADPTFLHRAYLNKAVIYSVIGDMYDDFTISDRTVAGDAVGEENMKLMYDSALSALDKGIPLATGDLKTTMTAVRARVKHAMGVWDLLNPVPAAPANPLVPDNGYLADAQAALAAGFTFYQVDVTDQNGGNPPFGFEINSRVEITPSPFFVSYLPSNKPAAVIVKDIIETSKVDPFANAAIQRTNFPDAPNNPPLWVTSAAEMRLLVAEAALAAGNTAGFDQAINGLRATEGLAPYTGAGPSRLALLEYERRVVLLFMGRRLSDMYRFGTVDPQWNANSTAVRQRGCLFPIGFSEREANPNLGESYVAVCQ
jgi:starch-binding outer membrane protein, SusD/RagB family